MIPRTWRHRRGATANLGARSAGQSGVGRDRGQGHRQHGRRQLWHGQATGRFAPYRFETPGEHVVEIKLAPDALPLDNSRFGCALGLVEFDVADDGSVLAVRVNGTATLTRLR